MDVDTHRPHGYGAARGVESWTRGHIETLRVLSKANKPLSTHEVHKRLEANGFTWEKQTVSQFLSELLGDEYVNMKKGQPSKWIINTEGRRISKKIRERRNRPT